MRAKKVGTSLWPDALTTNRVHKVETYKGLSPLTRSLSEGLILNEIYECYLAFLALSTGRKGFAKKGKKGFLL